MSTTRKASPDSNPEHSNERHMSNPLINGIGIGTNFVTRCARARTPRERQAMLWLTRYAHTLDLTQDAVAHRLGLERAAVREALTNPEGDISAFVHAVSRLRAEFESALDAPGSGRFTHPHNPFHVRLPWHEACGTPANTLVFRKVRSAYGLAQSKPVLVEIQGLERLGKTISLRHHFLRHMDCAAWIDSPVGRTEIDWLRALAAGFGVGAGGTALKPSQLRPRLEACLGPGKIELLVLDEAHKLLPRDLRQRPDRLEDLRSYLDRFGVSVILGTTPQFAQMVSAMVTLADTGESFWRPGQHIGRRQAYDLPETLRDEDLAAIASWHAPSLTERMVCELVTWAKTDPGYIGTMVKIIERAAHQADGGKITQGELEDAKGFVTREARQAALAAAGAAKIVRLPRSRKMRPTIVVGPKQLERRAS